jgi:hypothetical protein
MASTGQGIDLSIPLPEKDKRELLARLEARTLKTETCWLWRGYIRNQNGHAAISVHNRPVFIHQLSYAIHHGPIPHGLVVRHQCDVPPCWCPEHLLLGAQVDNVNDMHERGRAVDPPRITGERHHMVTLTDAQVAEIRAKWAANPRDQRALAAEYGVRQSTIWRLVHRVTRTEQTA